FRNPLLLGLAIWFSKTEPLVLLRDFCYRCFVPLASFFPTGGVAASISVRIRRQLLLLRPAGFFVSPAPSSDFRRFLEGERLLLLRQHPGQPLVVSFPHRISSECCLPDFFGGARLLPLRRFRRQLAC
ncbi:hypothetical protein, partial [Corallococcus silvisoli]|uniref:hypothetical protein n=1 Tax=Corallococcus silvisoli TaxID=2697031 RepID=UPI001F43708B